MKKEDKVVKVNELVEKAKSSSAMFAADYRGLNVAEARELRNGLRELGARVEVVKNSLMKRAADEAGIEAVKEYLEGPTAITFCEEDAAAVAKQLIKFAKDFEPLEIKGGIIDGESRDVDYIKFLASLPPEDVLRAQLLGGLQAPVRGLATVLAGPARGLVTVLSQIQEQKEKEAA